MTQPPLPENLGPLNEQQEQAVLSVNGPLLILAGAGSGKTRVLTRRIAYMLHIGIEAENLFAVTFTNKAAAEMKERVIELVGELGRKVWVSTFHSSCCRILRMEAEALGYTPRFAIYDDDDQLRIVKQILLDLGYDPKVVTPKSILSKIDHYKNQMMNVDDLVKQHRSRPSDTLVRVWREYEESLMASDAMDFNDLIGKAVTLFQEHPDILEKYRERFKYVMVDEYQDTNRTQYLLLQMLTQEHRNLAVVGDDDQSIYRFRGADISNILNFEKDYPDATVVRMEQNYRCTDNILSLANAVVAKNEERIEKRLWTQTVGGAKVSFLQFKDNRDEAQAVGRHILDLRRRGKLFKDICVIYRTNMTSQPFELAFSDLRIPHKVVGGRQFYSRREIRDTLCYLRLILNPADDAAFLRVCNVPTRGLGTKTVAQLREEAQNRGEPLLKTARSMARGQSRAAKAYNRFVQIIDTLSDDAQRASLPALVKGVLDQSGYLTMLVEEDSKEARKRIANLQVLLRDSANYEPPDDLLEEPTPVDLLHGWLDKISLAGSDEEIPEEGEVTLMTVHNSKGLEYPVVFVVNMVEGQFPHSRSAEEEGGISEERRLAYVAFTRAQKLLYVSRVKSSSKRDGKTGKLLPQPAAASRFLYGIPHEACSGAIPTLEELEEEQDLQLKEPAHLRRLRSSVKMADLEKVVYAYQQQPPPTHNPLPAHDLETIELEDPSQLYPGAKILHRRFGVGEVVRFVGATLHVRFEGGLKRLALTDERIELVRD